ncbi:hypothetical protein [Hymenobacter properus]|uniref:STAS/SEC14 domain-containing protein n=1 Tax=Hymenobacter properus TaxID=2791026 RepID=A0A931BJV1_9BACT|nr:hypothetical protein [Hymenobacter properus]MBF9142672.1 hypothetical protein [Hymenobacter properus]MBR7721480.1 hypothetical protein [Microvirga sp. SRT04]
MYQELASTAFLQVVYRPDSCLLIGRWLCSITEEQLHEGYETMRLAAREHKCRHWLMDARRRTDRRRNGPEWVVTRFLPQVQQEMGGKLYVAFLVLPNHLIEIEADPSVPEKPPGASAPFQYARFIDEGAANTWLEQKRRGKARE